MSVAAEFRPYGTHRDALAARRRALFREAPGDTLRRVALGTAWALAPKRIDSLPALASLWLRDLVSPDRGLPDPGQALNRAGLCGIARDLSVPTLVAAYRQGLFPFAHFGPMKWLSPAERCVLVPEDFHLGKNLRRMIRQGRHRVTFDRDFEGVLRACAERRAGKWHLTWIAPRIMHAYAALHDAGYAHSVEVWNPEGDLVGGCYGVAIGGVFFGESMFSRERETSKIASTALNWHLAGHGFTLHDAKWMNPLLASMGYGMIPRAEFRARLAEATALPGLPGRWQVETDLATLAAWRPCEARKPAPAVAEEPVRRPMVAAAAFVLAMDVLSDGAIAQTLL